MTNPIAQTRTVEDGGHVYQTLVFWCPGCERVDEDGSRHAGLHMLPVTPARSGLVWEYDGNLAAPTLSPSIKTTTHRSGVEGVCHSYLRAGRMEFLSDCTHPLAGQTVPLPPLPDWAVEECNT